MSSKAIIGRRAAPAASDHELVDLARCGHESAMSEIVRRYERPLRAYCAGLVGRDRAQDAVQQTFVQVVVALRAERERDLILRPWLYRIARNCSIDLLRKDTGNHDQLDPEFDGVPQPPAIAEQREAIKSLVTALRSLPEGQRRALTLREFEGRSYREIAGELGQTASSARQLIFRARSSLRGGVAALLPFAPLRAWLVGQAPASEALVLAGASGGRGTTLIDAAAAVAAATVALVGGGAAAANHVASGRTKASAIRSPALDLGRRVAAQQSSGGSVPRTFALVSRPASSKVGYGTTGGTTLPDSALPVDAGEPGAVPGAAAIGAVAEAVPLPAATVTPGDIALAAMPAPAPGAPVAVAPSIAAQRPAVAGAWTAQAAATVPQGLTGDRRAAPTVRPASRARVSTRLPQSGAPATTPAAPAGKPALSPSVTAAPRTDKAASPSPARSLRPAAPAAPAKAPPQAPPAAAPAGPIKRPASSTSPTRTTKAKPTITAPKAGAPKPNATTRS